MTSFTVHSILHHLSFHCVVTLPTGHISNLMAAHYDGLASKSYTQRSLEFGILLVFAHVVFRSEYWSNEGRHQSDKQMPLPHSVKIGLVY